MSKIGSLSNHDPDDSCCTTAFLLGVVPIRHGLKYRTFCPYIHKGVFSPFDDHWINLRAPRLIRNPQVNNRAANLR